MFFHCYCGNLFVEKQPNMLICHDFLYGLHSEYEKYKKYDKNMVKYHSLLPLQDSYLLSLSHY